jgi:hypothetical protein
MGAAANRERQALVTGEIDGGDDVGGIARPNDDLGPQVDHGIPDAPRLVVTPVRRCNNLAAKLLTESVFRTGVDSHDRSPWQTSAKLTRFLQTRLA